MLGELVMDNATTLDAQSQVAAATQTSSLENEHPTKTFSKLPKARNAAITRSDGEAHLQP